MLYLICHNLATKVASEGLKPVARLRGRKPSMQMDSQPQSLS
jgi:hypothetical protein